MLVTICAIEHDPLSHSCDDGVIVRKMMFHVVHLPSARTDGWSESAKSGLHGGCGRTLEPNSAMYSTVLKLVWALTLSCCSGKVSSSVASLWNSSLQRSITMSVWLPGNPGRSRLSYPKRQATSRYLLTAVLNVSLIETPHVANPHTVIVIHCLVSINF